MVATATGEARTSLRDILKTETSVLHDRLDSRLAGAAVGSRDEYIAFLSVQYAARSPIERWAAQHIDPDMCPPAMAGLIAGDLADLNADLPEEMEFSLPPEADPIGLAWAMGGSALGNKSLLAARRRADAPGPERFLADRSMAQYFTQILPHLEAISAAPERAVTAAATVFETFLAAADANRYEAAA